MIYFKNNFTATKSGDIRRFKIVHMYVTNIIIRIIGIQGKFGLSFLK